MESTLNAQGAADSLVVVIRRWSAMPCLLVGVMLTASLPAAVHANPRPLLRVKQPKVTPADAQAQRVAVQETARALGSAGDHRGAGREYDEGAAVHGDPILFLDAAEAYLEAAADERDTGLAQGAIERAYTAIDIVYFHLDSAADKNFRLVETGDIPDLITRGNQVVARGESLIEEIRLEAQAPPPPPPAEPSRPAHPGRAKIVTGAALATVGGGLLAMGAVGLGLGAARQSEAEDPTVYGDQYDDVERRGKQANVIAGVGLAVGAVALGAGIALVLAGRKSAKAAKPGDNLVELGPMFGSGSGGLTVTGRF
jgi:hypothetical protein